MNKKNGLAAAALGLSLVPIACWAQQPARSNSESVLDSDVPALTSVLSLSALASDGAYSTLVGADFALTEKSRLTLDAGYSHSSQDSLDVTTYRGGIGFDHDFNPVGFTIGYNYWGDQERITSHGVRGSLYVHGERGRAAVVYERRNIELEFDVPSGARGFVDNSRSTDSNGYGLNLRLNTEHVDFYANGMDYDYDVDLSRLAQLINQSRLNNAQRTAFLANIRTFLFNLSRLNASSLSLASMLLDYNVTIGSDIRTGSNSLNFELARDVAATDGVTLDSASVSFTHPVGKRFDIEYRIGGSKGDDVDSSFFGGITLYWYR